MRWGHLVPLPLIPRFLLPGFVTIAATYAVAWQAPDAFFYIGAENIAPRAVSPFEYAPTLVALALCIGLAPRFHDWDLYGTSRTRALALVNMLTAVLVPQLVFSTALLLYPDAGEPPASALIPIASNLAVSALLASICVGLLGPLIGTLSWAATAYLLMSWQSNAPEYLAMLPYTMSNNSAGYFDDSGRWVWIVALSVCAITIAWLRRSVPFRITLRPAEG